MDYVYMQMNGNLSQLKIVKETDRKIFLENDCTLWKAKTPDGRYKVVNGRSNAYVPQSPSLDELFYLQELRKKYLEKLSLLKNRCDREIMEKILAIDDLEFS